MEKSALIPLSAVGSYPPSHVGQQALLLVELERTGVPVAETQVIPSDILARLTEETHLAEKLSSQLKDLPRHNPHELSEALMAAIQKIELPKWFTNSIHQWYHQRSGFVNISIGTIGSTTTTRHQVKGEANIIDTIVNLWAHQGQIDTRTKEFKLFARPILIQRETQPTTSGSAAKSSHNKSTMIVKAVWGVYAPNHPEIKPSEFVVDVRTHQVVSRHHTPQYTQLVRELDSLHEKNVLHYQQTEACLTDAHLQQLSEILGKVSRVIYEDYTIQWSLAEGQLYFTSVDSAQSHAEPSSTALLTGQVVCPGIVGGSVGTEILVVPELTAEHLPLLSKVSAVVCDRGISSPSLLQQLKKQQVATIMNTHQATKLLQIGQRVIVDANAGKVLRAPQPLTQESLTPLHTTTATKLFISAGNPDKAAEYVTPLVDGVGVLRSEYTFAQFGDHPLAVIRSRKRGQLKKALHDTIRQYHTANQGTSVVYRSLNFTTQELRAFSQAEAFEPVEMNPYLGFRGGLKLLQNQELFDFELEMMRDYLEKYSEPLGMMVPFIRSAGELQLVHNHLKNKRLHEFSHYSFWVQLNTPENLLSIDHYLRVPVDGFSINVRSIHALLHGVDPDEPEIYSLYPLDIKLFEQLLKPCVTAIIRSPHAMRGTKGHPAVVLHLEDNSTAMVDLAVRLGCTGVTVKPPFVATAKERIRETEGLVITQR